LNTSARLPQNRGGGTQNPGAGGQRCDRARREKKTLEHCHPAARPTTAAPSAPTGFDADGGCSASKESPAFPVGSTRGEHQFDVSVSPVSCPLCVNIWRYNATYAVIVGLMYAHLEGCFALTHCTVAR